MSMWQSALKGIALASVLMSVAAAEVEVKGTPAELSKYLRGERQFVTLTGHAKETVEADTGKMTVTVRTQAKELVAALAANAERRAQIARALQRDGIDAKNIRSARFSSSPQFGWLGKTPNSFEVVNQMEVTVNNEQQLTAVARLSDPSGDVNVGSASFSYSDREALVETLRRAAFDAAVAKKEFYERRLGVSLRPVRFYFDGAAPAPSVASGSIEEVIVTGERRNEDSRERTRANSFPSTPVFEGQAVEAWAVVTFEGTATAAVK